MIFLRERVRSADFPDLRIVVSHGNWPWVSEILHVAFRRPNVYLSPDMYLYNMPGMDDYLRAANGFLALKDGVYSVTQLGREHLLQSPGDGREETHARSLPALGPGRKLLVPLVR